MKANELIKKLKADGWYELPSGKTSHRHFKHPTKQGKATVSMHPGDIPLVTIKNIEKQTGLKLL